MLTPERTRTTRMPCRAKLTLQRQTSFTISQQLIGTKHKLCVTYGLKAWISNPAGQFMSLIWYYPCDCSHLSTEGMTMLNRFPATRWPWCHVQLELCGTNFHDDENSANLQVSCYNGNNDQSAHMLFVQHPREQGEWLHQNTRYARVLTIIPPAPPGTGGTTPSQPSHYHIFFLGTISIPKMKWLRSILWKL